MHYWHHHGWFYNPLGKEAENDSSVSLFKEHQKQPGRVIKKDYALDNLGTRYVGHKFLNRFMLKIQSSRFFFYMSIYKSVWKEAEQRTRGLYMKNDEIIKKGE